MEIDKARKLVKLVEERDYYKEISEWLNGRKAESISLVDSNGYAFKIEKNHTRLLGEVILSFCKKEVELKNESY